MLLLPPKTLQSAASGDTLSAWLRSLVRSCAAQAWSPASTPSRAFIPRATVTPAITIQGKREGKRIRFIGVRTRLGPAITLQPWFKLSGQSSLLRGSTKISLDVDG